jgi:hypothetical protein
MKKTTNVLAALAIGAAAIGISIAPSAAADPNNCQTVGGATVCSQGGQSAAPNGPAAGPPGVNSCLNAFGTYQRCNRGGGGGGG